MAVTRSTRTRLPTFANRLLHGHTDGTAPGSTLWRNNNLVRAYVAENDKVLFDFADIKSYDPAGTFYPTAG